MNKSLTQKRLKELFNYDHETGIFTRIITTSPTSISGTVAGSDNGEGYLLISVDRKRYKVHRLAFLYMTGMLPKNCVDHINGVRNDNRWINLREANNSENTQNLKKARIDNKTGLLGVYYHKQSDRFRASIMVNGNIYNLGNFRCKYEAFISYIIAKRLIHPYGEI